MTRALGGVLRSHFLSFQQKIVGLGRCVQTRKCNRRRDRSVHSDGEHDLSLWLGPRALQYEVSLARIREG